MIIHLIVQTHDHIRIWLIYHYDYMFNVVKYRINYVWIRIGSTSLMICNDHLYINNIIFLMI